MNREDLKTVWALVLHQCNFDELTRLSQTWKMIDELITENESTIYKQVANRLSPLLQPSDFDIDQPLSENRSDWFNCCERFVKMNKVLPTISTAEIFQSNSCRPWVLGSLKPKVIGNVDLETNISVHSVVPGAISHLKPDRNIISVFSRRNRNNYAVFSLETGELEHIEAGNDEERNPSVTHELESWKDFRGLQHALALRGKGVFSRPVSIKVDGILYDSLQIRQESDKVYYVFSSVNGRRRSSPELTAMDMKREPPFYLVYFDGQNISSVEELMPKYRTNLATDPYNAYGQEEFTIFGRNFYVEIKDDVVNTSNLKNELISSYRIGLRNKIDRLNYGYALIDGYLLCCNSFDHTLWSLRIDGKGDGKWNCLLKVIFDEVVNDQQHPRLFLSKSLFYGRFIMMHGCTDFERYGCVCSVFVTFDTLTGTAQCCSFTDEGEAVLRLGSYLEPVEDPLKDDDKWYVYSNKWVIDENGQFFILNETFAEEWMSTFQALGLKGSIPLHIFSRSDSHFQDLANPPPPPPPQEVKVKA